MWRRGAAICTALLLVLSGCGGGGDDVASTSAVLGNDGAAMLTDFGLAADSQCEDQAQPDEGGDCREAWARARDEA